MRLLGPRIALVAAVLVASLVPSERALAFTDVPPSNWAFEAVTHVAENNDWMRDFGRDEFRPAARETKTQLARALVRAFAPSEPADPSITFSDLPATDPAYRYANVAVKRGWLRRVSGGAWAGDTPVRMRQFDRAIVLALGLRRAAKGLANIRQADGDRYRVGRNVPFLQLARWLRLHRDHTDEALDLQPSSFMRRDEVAYSLWRATVRVGSWKLQQATVFNDIVLPPLDPGRTKQKLREDLTAFALRQITFPYIWAGEWNARSPAGYCCGSQPQGGMDCSGFVWWVLKRRESGYDAARYRTYEGWSIPQRSSSEMARMTSTPLSFEQLRIGSLMFFSTDGGTGWRAVDHVGIWLGRGWMIHSTSGGPQLEWLGDEGWWRQRFLFGRDLAR